MIYVDSGRVPFRGFRMSHLVADTSAELEEFAADLDLAPEWVQFPGTYREHFDVCDTRRIQAIALGARTVTAREMGRILAKKRRNLAAQAAAAGGGS